MLRSAPGCRDSMSAFDRVPPRSDAMSTTRGTNFYLADPNLAFVCATVVGALSVKRWLRPPALPASVLTAAECGWLDAIVDWALVPAEALSGELRPRSSV
jgi:hypothetical protein